MKQQRTGEHLPHVAQSVEFKQALNWFITQKCHTLDILPPRQQDLSARIEFDMPGRL